jgi:hypothetical protein
VGEDCEALGDGGGEREEAGVEGSAEGRGDEVRDARVEGEGR